MRKTFRVSGTLLWGVSGTLLWAPSFGEERYSIRTRSDMNDVFSLLYPDISSAKLTGIIYQAAHQNLVSATQICLVAWVEIR